MTVGAVLFDFDGVLAESAEIKAWAFDKLYEDFPEAVRAGARAHHAAHAGISRLEKIRHVHRSFLGIEPSDGEVADWGRRYNALVEDAVVAAPWVPGARVFVEAHHRGLPLYVVSGTPEDELRRIAERRAMAHFFKGIFGSPRHKAPIIRDILAAEGLAPGRVLFIGDATTDSTAAAATGLRFLGRVPPGAPNPFPPGTEIVPDLTGLSVA
ncbi:MAG: HAD hydrolase-like protein [Magnetospirillum sp. WYHS-4]